MIHTNELMLGNWVEYEIGINGDKRSIPMYVVAIDEEEALLSFEGNEIGPLIIEQERLRGIPITEELLERFCVKRQPIKKRPTFTVFYIEPSVQILKYDGLWSFSYEGKVHSRIKFLHELQNAYFMLTKKRLEVKL